MKLATSFISMCPTFHGRLSRLELSAGAAAPVLFRAWQFVAEGCMYTEGGFLGQDSTVHVGLPSEPIWLKNNTNHQFLSGIHRVCENK